MRNVSLRAAAPVRRGVSLSELARQIQQARIVGHTGQRFGQNLAGLGWPAPRGRVGVFIHP